MKRVFTALLVVCVWTATVAQALPALAHAASGVVQSVDIEKNRLRLEATSTDTPTEFLIVEGRTRLRCDKKPAKLADLAPGQRVRVRYKREATGVVATEIAWESPKP